MRNRYFPEGCIPEAYLKEESVEFRAEFSINSFTTAGLLKDQGKLSGPLSAATAKSVEEKEPDEEKKTVQWMIGEHNRLFADWFENKVMTELNEKVEGVSEMIRWLAGKPSFTILTFDGYLVDGIRYFIKERDDARVVQNSGVSLVAKTFQISSAKDLNPIESDMTFYGRIEEIRGLDYYSFKAPLPPEFKGSADPVEANAWLKEIEKAFDLVGEGAELKTKFVSYFLKGEANYWWESTRALEGGEFITWERFIKLFLENYFPRYMKNQMEIKFLNLTQGDLTVAEYEAKFTELARFVPNQVDTDEKKA
ncbi:hypothetical protein AgCh_034738 [Apium graveolens]